MDGLYNKTLFLSIVGYCDTQLLLTIKNALSQAKNPKNIYIAVIEQDSSNNFDEISNMVNSYGSTLYYEHYLPEQAHGVVWARHRAQQYLDKSIHDYYFQTDSHARYIYHYDSFLINDYEHAFNYWGNFVWTAYAPDYEYDPITQTDKLQNDRPHMVLKGMLWDSTPSRIKGDVALWSYNPYGDICNHTSGHMLFGRSTYFLDNPFDPNLYWDGEESTLAARFYCNNIKTISPPKIYTYHLYDDGSRNTRSRPGDARHVEMAKNGISRAEAFWSGKVEEPYGVSSVDKLNKFLYGLNREVYDGDR